MLLQKLFAIYITKIYSKCNGYNWANQKEEGKGKKKKDQINDFPSS